MKKLSIIVIIFVLFFSISAGANDSSNREGTVIKGDVLSLGEEENGSRTYVVKKGDTLWDVSSDKLEDNFLWPKLWKFNPQVKNPDLIYPGDILRIPSREELRSLAKSGEMKPVPVRKKRIASPKKVVKQIPIVKEPQYLMDKDAFNALSWIAPEDPSVGEIMKDPAGMTVFGKHDTVYVKTGESFSTGERLFAINVVKIIRHPKTRRKLGHLVHITGILDIIGMEGGYVKAQISRSYRETLAGYGIIPYRESDPPIVPKTARKPAIGGHIVESYRTTVMSSEGDLVFLDKGLNDGLMPGDIFSVFSSETIKRIEGTVQVVSLKSETSAAIVTDSSRELLIGDTWGNK